MGKSPVTDPSKVRQTINLFFYLCPTRAAKNSRHANIKCKCFLIHDWLQFLINIHEPLLNLHHIQQFVAVWRRRVFSSRRSSSWRRWVYFLLILNLHVSALRIENEISSAVSQVRSLLTWKRHAAPSPSYPLDVEEQRKQTVTWVTSKLMWWKFLRVFEVN